TGTMGSPNRVTRRHGHLLDEFRTVSNVLGITSKDRILAAAPFFHTYGLMTAISTVLSEGTLYTVDRFFPREVARLIEREKITGFWGVPFMFQLLAELRQ